MKHLKLATFVPENRFFLAPMEAVNCASFRLLCKRRGAALVYTNMIDADRFTEYAKETSPEEAITKFINPQKEEQPLAIQLLGANTTNLKYTYDQIKQHAAVIDYNASCPLGTVLGKKAGVYLMKHPDQLYKILKELRDHIKLPLTIKIRSGWDKETINAIEISKEAENIGIDAVAIHPRTRKQVYRDRADWKLVKEIKKVTTIPVILSGDVFNAYDAHKAFSITNCDFIMIGRAARANPSIFTQLNKYDKTGELPTKPNKIYCKNEVSPYRDFKDFLELYKKIEPRYNFSELRDHALWTAIECKDSKETKQKILRAKTEQELVEIIKHLKF